MKYLLNDTQSYFASANSFNGFKSSFKKAFNPEKFERIYILKGGPGTGKSSLMKRIAEYFMAYNCQITRYLCSSDPTSLDGVVVMKNNKRIAIIDGTAPHITDPEAPGACERIINLAEALDFNALSKRKTEILSLSNKKKEGYEKAYKCLFLAGEIHDAIWGLIKKSNAYKEAETISDKILEYELFSAPRDEFMDYCYLSAFGKDGYVRLDIPCIEKEYISVVGDGFTEHLVMREVYKKLIGENVILTLASSALSDKEVDVITTESCIIATDNVGSIVFDTSPLVQAFDSEYKELVGVYKRMLSLSESYFKAAAESHFALERIYSSNIDFTYSEEQIGRIKTETKEIFDS